MAAFYDVLKKNGVNCVVRQEHGTDIDAACGQLRSNTMNVTVEKVAGASLVNQKVSKMFQLTTCR